MEKEDLDTLTELVKGLSAQVNTLSDANAALNEQIKASEKRSESLEQHLSTANSNIDQLKKQTQAPLRAFNHTDARVFQETRCDCPPASQETCFHRPPNRLASLPRIRATLTADTPPDIARSVLKDQFDKSIFQQVLAPRESFYYTLVSSFPHERQKVATSYLKLNPPGSEAWRIKKEHEFFRNFLQYVLENCFASLGYDEALQRYDSLKQTSGVTPAAYIAEWEELFLRIFSGLTGPNARAAACRCPPAPSTAAPKFGPSARMPE